MAYLRYLNPYKLHIGLHDLATGTLFSGLTLALLLAFANRPGKAASLFLSSALTVMVLKTGGLTAFFLPSLGPLLYFYVRKLSSPDRRFHRKDLLHFCSLLAAFWMPAWLALISVIIYLYLAHRLVEDFYRRLRPVLMDRPRFAFRRLESILLLLGFFCVLSLFNDIFYLAVAFILIGMAVEAILKPDTDVRLAMPITDRSDAREKGRRLRETVAANRLFEDAELTLTSLAVKLMMHPHDLSRIINQGIGKNFSDFINEFRVREISRKIQDPAYDRLTLLGIAYESGFNSKRTFNRVFKEVTGKTPVEYKNSLRKEGPIDRLAPPLRMQPVILRPESPPNWASEKLKRNFMIKSYIKIAYRSLKKTKGFTFINVFGLALGLATCLLIVFYVFDELSYDRYNVKIDRVFRLNYDIKFGGVQNTYAITPPIAAAALKADFPQVEETVRFRDAGGNKVKKGAQNIQEDRMVYADNSIFDVFTLPLITGDAAHALTEPHTAVVTEDIAKKYFDKTDVVGRVFTFNDTSLFKITAVIKNIPQQSHFHFDFFMSMPTIAKSRDNSWLYNNFNTYFLIRPGFSYKSLAARLPEFLRRHAEAQLQSTLHMNFAAFEKSGNSLKFTITPLKDIHLKSAMLDEFEPNGDITYVYIFSAIAVFILLIACVNFMNLSTARSANRAREVGVRKVLGSPRKYLVAQFLTESILVTLVGAIIAVLAAWAFLPLFNQLSGKQLVVTPQVLAWLVPALLIIIVVIGCLAGSYPALFLSGFQPINVLKGKLSAGFKGSALRSVLVVFQFAISIILIIGTLVIYNQLKFIRNKDLGYNREHILIVKNLWSLGRGTNAFKQEVKQLAGVQNAALSNSLPTDNGGDYTSSSFKNPILNQKDAVLSHQWYVDEDYVPTLHMQIIAGRNFSKEMVTDSSAVIINEAFEKLLGYQNPLGHFIYTPANSELTRLNKLHIVGVVKNFNFRSLKENVPPLVLNFQPNMGVMSVCIKTTDIAGLLDQIKNKWSHVSSGQQFSYSFMDQEFDAIYRSEQRMGAVSIAFTALAVIIACLGLFGLAAYAAEQRTKEIGVRKILGASVSTIVAMISGDFIKLVLISITIAAPIAWWAMQKWLQSFAYRQNIQWWVIAAAGVAAMLIAFITISFQSIRAASANPVKSLRSE